MKRFRKIRSFYHRLQMYNVHSELFENPQIKLHNWCVPAPQDFWIPRFVEQKKLVRRKSVGIFSVFGVRPMIRLDRSDIKIFLARENVHRPNWSRYDDVCLGERSLDLCIGFDYDIKDERYIRFPLWIMWLFPPDVTFDEVKSFCRRVNSIDNSSFDDRKFCSFISSHDDDGRKELFNEISTIAPIDSAGRFMHNNDDLKGKFADDKLAFLRHYRFNLCPENSNSEGYCTEKIFEAISSGCVPIYWGSNNNPEPEVLNHEAVCFINVGKANDEKALMEISSLNSDKSKYLDFARQPRLKNEAPDIIMQYICDFEDKLNRIIKEL